MTTPFLTPHDVRAALLLRREIALLDVRHEAAFAAGHPLFAANMAADRIAIEAAPRLPRKHVPIVLYDDGEGLVAPAADRLEALGYTNVGVLGGGLKAWRDAGYEIFQDVNSYAKAFGELVEARRHTPSLSADEVAALIASKADIAILDVRRFDEYATMNIPGSLSVPGAELVLRAASAAPDPATTIIVNCAGRTRSIIGTQSLINARVRNKVCALRNGTTGWTLARHILEHGSSRRGLLMQEIDMAAPVRGARILFTDDKGVRADMTASWLAQMAWEVHVLEGGYDGPLESVPPLALPRPDPSHRYRRPYEGTESAEKAMQAYLDWEFGLVEQLRRDDNHGFFVI